MNPVLVECYRGEVIESFHRGVVCVVNEYGEILEAIGDVSQICYPRSAMKLFQHIPFLMSDAVKKYKLTDEEIAIMCGSHNGEERHLNVVKGILDKAGFTLNDLLCGPQMPTLKEDIINLYKTGQSASTLHNNCSGKHAGFLLCCQHFGWDTANYINPDHPLQMAIKNICAEFYEYKLKEIKTGMDGCSAPIFSFPVYNQAVSFKNLILPSAKLKKYKPALDIINRAVLANPFMLAGSKRYCTDLMRSAGDNIIGKTGADGIYCIAIKSLELGICIKIDDGKMGPQYLVAENILENLQVLTSEAKSLLREYKIEHLKNYAKREVGKLKVAECVKNFSVF